MQALQASNEARLNGAGSANGSTRSEGANTTDEDANNNNNNHSGGDNTNGNSATKDGDSSSTEKDSASIVSYHSLMTQGLDRNHSICVYVDGRLQAGWHFRLSFFERDYVMAVACGPPQDGAPSFKATFSLEPSDPLWKASPAPPEVPMRLITVQQIMEGMPECKKQKDTE